MNGDRGAPISYLVLAEGTPVQASDGRAVGKVRRVLADEGADLFDGIVVATDRGERFVDAPEVEELYERLVILGIDSAAVGDLPEPTPAPAVVDLSPDDLVGEAGADRRRGGLRRLWDRLSGNY
jgi:hypothetical protein